MNIARWLGPYPEPLAAILGHRIALFQQTYCLNLAWPVIALPATLSEIFGFDEIIAEAFKEGCALFFLAADLIDDAQDLDLPNDFSWQQAINGGQALLFAALKALATTSPEKAILEEAIECGSRLSAGQALDLFHKIANIPKEEQIMVAISGKSGATLRLFARIGAILAKRSDFEIEALGSYGEKLAIVLQLASDLEELRNPNSSDLRNGRITLPILFASKLDIGTSSEYISKYTTNTLDIRRASTKVENISRNLLLSAQTAVNSINMDKYSKIQLINILYSITGKFISL